MKKKVLLSVLAAGLVLPSASVLAERPSDEELNKQTESVLNASKEKQRKDSLAAAEKIVVEYLAAHESDILAEASKFPEVVKAQAALDEFIYSGYAGHDYLEKKEALEKDLATAKQDAYNVVYKKHYDSLLATQLGENVKVEEGKDPEDVTKEAGKAKSGKDGSKVLPKTSAVK